MSREAPEAVALIVIRISNASRRSMETNMGSLQLHMRSGIREKAPSTLKERKRRIGGCQREPIHGARSGRLAGPHRSSSAPVMRTGQVSPPFTVTRRDRTGVPEKLVSECALPGRDR